MTVKEKALLVRTCIDNISKLRNTTNYDYDYIFLSEAKVLRGAGFVHNAHADNVNRKKLTLDNITEDDKLLVIEWFAGQILNIFYTDSYYAVNALLNLVDSIVPKSWCE